MNNNKDENKILHALDTACFAYLLTCLLGWLLSTRIGGFIILTLLGAAGAIYPICCILYWVFDYRDYSWGPIITSLCISVIPATITMAKIRK